MDAIETSHVLEARLKLFNFKTENDDFFVEIFHQNHPKIFRMTEFLILTICTHRVILTGEIIFSLAQCQAM